MKAIIKSDISDHFAIAFIKSIFLKIKVNTEIWFIIIEILTMQRK